jgi:hypothetical protein
MHKLRRLEGASGEVDDKISFRNFKVGDIALFMHEDIKDEDTFMAFHMGCPCWYLNKQSVREFRDSERRRREKRKLKQKEFGFVLGRIIYIEQELATAESNPFQLQLGTVFYTMEVEEVRRERSSSLSHTGSAQSVLTNTASANAAAPAGVSQLGAATYARDARDSGKAGGAGAAGAAGAAGGAGGSLRQPGASKAQSPDAGHEAAKK